MYFHINFNAVSNICAVVQADSEEEAVQYVWEELSSLKELKEFHEHGFRVLGVVNVCDGHPDDGFGTADQTSSLLPPNSPARHHH